MTLAIPCTLDLSACDAQNVVQMEFVYGFLSFSLLFTLISRMTE